MPRTQCQLLQLQKDTCPVQRDASHSPLSGAATGARTFIFRRVRKKDSVVAENRNVHDGNQKHCLALALEHSVAPPSFAPPVLSEPAKGSPYDVTYIGVGCAGGVLDKQLHSIATVMKESGVSAQLRRVVPGGDVQSLVSSAEVSLLQTVHGIIKQHECSGEKSPSTKKSACRQSPINEKSGRSSYDFQCNMCGTIEKISSGDKKKNSNRNMAWVSSMLLTRDKITSTLEIPCMAKETFNKYQNALSTVIHDIAWQRMEAAAKEEAIVTDGAWCKRSYGNQYDALSGVACIIEKETKKIIFEVQGISIAVFILQQTRKNETPNGYACFRNCKRSSNAMESDIIVEGFKCSVPMNNLKYNQLIGKEQIPVSLEGWESTCLVPKIASSYGEEKYARRSEALFPTQMGGALNHSRIHGALQASRVACVQEGAKYSVFNTRCRKIYGDQQVPQRDLARAKVPLRGRTAR
ncbi:hypothetical protein PR048_018690, partial [Dryococelus australis]